MKRTAREIRERMRENIRENLKDEGNLRDTIREDVMYYNTIYLTKYSFICSILQLTALLTPIYVFFYIQIPFHQNKESKVRFAKYSFFKNINSTYPAFKNHFQYSWCYTVFENYRKSRIQIQHYYIYIFSGQKFIKNAKSSQFCEFWKN